MQTNGRNGSRAPLVLDGGGRLTKGDRRATVGDYMPIPHILSYASILSGAYQTYYHGRQDEAMRKAREDALVMQRDAFLMSLMEERMRHVSTLNWHLEIPDENNPDQVLVRDHIKTTLTNMTGKDRSLRRVIKWGLWKKWFGRYAAQIRWKWEQQAGLRTLTVAKAFPVNGDKIIYKWSHVPAVQVNTVEDLPGAEYIPSTNEGSRALLLTGSWRNKFVIFTDDQEDSDFFDIDRADAIHGVGIRSKVFWLNWIRLEWESRVANFFDSLGTGGFLVFFYEQGNADSEEQVTAAAEKYSGFTKLILPRSIGDGGAGVEFLPAQMSGVEALNELRDVIRKDIQRYIVGQEGSGEATSGGGLGNEASTEFRMATKWKVAKDDAELLGEELTGDPDNPSLVYMMQAHTFPDSVPWKPNGFPVRFKFDLQEEQTKEKLEAAKTIVSMGIPLRSDDVRSAGGFGKPGEGDETVGGPETLGLEDPKAPPGGEPGEEPGGEESGADTAAKESDDKPEQFAEFREGDHPRAEDGKFGDKGEGIPKDEAGRPKLTHAERVEEFHSGERPERKLRISWPGDESSDMKVIAVDLGDGWTLFRAEGRPGIHLVETERLAKASEARKKRRGTEKERAVEDAAEREQVRKDAQEDLDAIDPKFAENLKKVVAHYGEYDEEHLTLRLTDPPPVGMGLTRGKAEAALTDATLAGHLDRKFKGRGVVYTVAKKEGKPDQYAADALGNEHSEEDGKFVSKHHAALSAHLKTPKEGRKASAKGLKQSIPEAAGGEFHEKIKGRHSHAVAALAEASGHKPAKLEKIVARGIAKLGKNERDRVAEDVEAWLENLPGLDREDREASALEFAEALSKRTPDEHDVDDAFDLLLSGLEEKFSEAEWERLSPGEEMPPDAEFHKIGDEIRASERAYHDKLVKSLADALLKKEGA